MNVTEINATEASLAAQRVDATLTASLDTTWLLVMAILVFFMQGGFAALEAGAVAPKNAKHILFKNVLDLGIGVVSWFALGYGFAFGDSAKNGFIGLGNFFLSNRSNVDLAFWFFQSTFVITAATITSGALAERCNTAAYVTYSCLMATFIYPVVVHWVWSGEGWLSAAPADGFGPIFSQGMIDFAGGGVVHAVGGMSALMGAYMVGYRNEFSTDPMLYRPRFQLVGFEGKEQWVVNEMMSNSVSLQAMGVFILWFGWFGFNCGSMLAVTGFGPVVALIAVNSVVAGAAASLTATIMGRYTNVDEKFSMSDALNGALCGLVSITSGCSVVEPWAAFIIGLVAGFVYKGASDLMLRFRLDDPLDAVAVHLAGGTWAAVSVGLFASEELLDQAYGAGISGGLLTEGKAILLGVNLFGFLMIVLWTGTWAFGSFYLLHRMDMLRITPEQEEAGLGVDLGDSIANPRFDELGGGEEKSQSKGMRSSGASNDKKLAKTRHGLRFVAGDDSSGSELKPATGIPNRYMLPAEEREELEEEIPLAEEIVKRKKKKKKVHPKE